VLVTTPAVARAARGVVAPEDGSTVQASVWLRSLHRFVRDVTIPEQPFQAVATHDYEYYLKKYPLVPR